MPNALNIFDKHSSPPWYSLSWNSSELGELKESPLGVLQGATRKVKTNSQCSFRSIWCSVGPRTCNRLLSSKLLLSWERRQSHGKLKHHKAVSPRLAGLSSLSIHFVAISFGLVSRVPVKSILTVFCFVFASLLLLFERMWFWRPHSIPQFLLCHHKNDFL